MRRFGGIALCAMLLAGLAGAAPAGAPPEPRAKPTIVSTDVDRPPRQRAYRTRFRPWPRPTVKQVHTIISVEARRWGVSAARLTCRIRGESTFGWWEVNGSHRGLGQFKRSTYNRGLRTLGSRWVRLTLWRSSVRRALVTRRYSNGTVRRWRGRRYRVRIRKVLLGRLPSRPAWTHGWTQVRIMAQAMAGRSAVGDGEWSVRC